MTELAQPLSDSPARYRDFFFRIDPRSLGLFRVSMALVMLAVWVIRWRWLSVMYTDDGVLPRELLNSLGSLYFPYTPLAWIGSEWGVRLFFLAALGSYLMMLVGYRTRLATVLAWAFYISISHRNPYILIGADFVIASMMTWAILLPLGKRFSVDAIRNALKSPTPLRDRAKGSEWDHSALPAVEKVPASLVALFIVIHFGLIYLFTGVWKTGPTWWESGTALFFVLRMEHSLYPVGAMLAEAPMWFLKSLAYGTLIMEYVALPMFLVPWGQPWLRRLMLIVLAGFHIGIALTIDAGVFSYAMMACFPLLLLPRDWESLARFGKRFARPVTAYYDDNCGICTASCKVLAAVDRFGMISFIGNSFTEDFRHDVSPELTQQTIVVFDERTGKRGIRSAGVGMLLRALPFPGPVLSIIGLPGIRAISDLGYRLVASNRTRISRLLGMNACSVPQPGAAKTQLDDGSPVNESAAAVQPGWSALWSNLLAAAIMVSVLCGMYYRNLVPIMQWSVDPSTPLNRVGLFVMEGTYLTMSEQYWNMFAPDAPTVDTWWVAEATLEDGRRIDLFNGGQPCNKLRQPRRWETPITSVWGNYLRHAAAQGMMMPSHMLDPNAQRDANLCRQAVARYVMREYAKSGGTPIAEFKLYLLVKHTIAPGEPQNDVYTVIDTLTYTANQAEGERYRGPEPLGESYAFNQQGAKIAEGFRDPWNLMSWEGFWTFWSPDGARKTSAGPFTNSDQTGFWIEYIRPEDGGGVFEGMLVKGQKQGLWRHSKRVQGREVVVGEQTFQDNELHGHWKRNYDSGKTYLEGQYEHGQRVGLWHSYSEDGRREQHGSYVAGERDGEWTKWEDGVQVTLETYQAGKLHGPWQNNWPGGTPESTGQYADGQRVGLWKEFYPDGTPKAAGEFVAGKKHGEWKEWITGGLARTRRYEHGQLVEN